MRFLGHTDPDAVNALLCSTHAKAFATRRLFLLDDNQTPTERDYLYGTIVMLPANRIKLGELEIPSYQDARPTRRCFPCDGHRVPALSAKEALDALQ